MATTPHTHSHTTESNDVVFLGINFGNFFKYCDCIRKRMDDNASQVSSDAEDQSQFINKEKKQQMLDNGNAGTKDTLDTHPNDHIAEPYCYQPLDGQNMPSDNDWMDLDDFTVPNDFDFGHLTLEGANKPEMGQEEYFTQDPINFDYIKDDKEAAKEEKEDDINSSSSKISKNSKKIAKQPLPDEEGYPKSSFAPKKTDYVKGRRKPWQPHEDAKVIELVSKYGQSWAVVASMMGGRSGKQIRDRYLNKLRPNIKKGEWTPEEDNLLLGLYYQLGHKWSKIATYLPGRTEGQVKNRFYSHIKKRLTGMEGATPDGVSQSDGDSSIRKDEIPMEAILASPNALNSFSKHFTNELQMPFESAPFKNEQLGSPGSDLSRSTQQSGAYNNENDVDMILDKVAGLMEKRPNVVPVGESPMDLEKMSLEEKLAAVDQENLSNLNPTDRLDKLEQLQKRRNKLELLLAQTMKDMNLVNPVP